MGRQVSFCGGREATDTLEMVESMLQKIMVVQWNDQKAVNQ